MELESAFESILREREEGRKKASGLSCGREGLLGGLSLRKSLDGNLRFLKARFGLGNLCMILVSLENYLRLL